MRKHLRLNQIIRKDLQGTNQRKVWYPPEVVFIRRMHATCREDHEAGINKWDFEMTWGKGNIRRSEQKDLLCSGTSRDDMEGAEETKPHRLRWCSSGVLFDPIWSEVDEWMNDRVGALVSNLSSLMDFRRLRSWMNKQEMIVVRNRTLISETLARVSVIVATKAFVSIEFLQYKHH